MFFYSLLTEHNKKPLFVSDSSRVLGSDDASSFSTSTSSSPRTATYPPHSATQGGREGVRVTKATDCQFRQCELWKYLHQIRRESSVCEIIKNYLGFSIYVSRALFIVKTSKPVKRSVIYLCDCIADKQTTRKRKMFRSTCFGLIFGRCRITERSKSRIERFWFEIEV